MSVIMQVYLVHQCPHQANAASAEGIRVFFQAYVAGIEAVAFVVDLNDKIVSATP